MSIQNLLHPNQFNLFANVISAEDISAATATIDQLNITDIHATSLAVTDILTNTITFGAASKGSVNLSFSGGIPATAHNVQYERVDNQVTLTFPDFLAASSGASAINTAVGDLPAFLCPVGIIRSNFVIIVQNNGIDAFGRMEIQPDGQIVISNGAAVADVFTAGTVGFLACSVTYQRIIS